MALSRRLFAGSNYEENFDYKRLTKQIDRIFFLMMDGRYRTLSEIQKTLEERYPGNHFPESSISAQLRNLRKPEAGSHVINKQPRGERENGLFEYNLDIKKSLFNQAC